VAAVSARTHIQFELLENARDSLRQAVHLLVWDDLGTDHARLKHAITSAAHSVELLLKEILRRINPAFVWENVDKYPSLEARTVSSEHALSRLKLLANISFLKTDEDNLRSLRRTRNAIEHYEWRATEKEEKIVIGNALSFAFSFAKEHLEVDLSADFKDDDTWNVLVEDLSEFARAHGQRIEAELRKKGQSPNWCDGCGENTVPTHGGSCELCGHWQSIDDE
jgi:hypothetical protein